MRFFWEIVLSAKHVDSLDRPPPSSAVPRATSLFEPVRDRYGWRLALVFGNHAPGGFCPYYTEERCFHCDIGAGEGASFDLTTNRQRLAWFQEYYRPHLDSINHLVLYNSGSVFNPHEMPPVMLDEIVAFARSMPAVRVISIDSREPFITLDTLRRMLALAGPGITIRPILGIESSNEQIRNEILRKAMPRAGIDRVFRDLGVLAAEFGDARIGLDVNIVIAGPGTAPERSDLSTVLTAVDALVTAANHGVKVDLNLHPYYPSSRGRARFPDHPRCSLATTVRAAAQIAEVVEAWPADCKLFIGWNDEGHDCEREQRTIELERARAAFDRFNQTNDPAALQTVAPLPDRVTWREPDHDHGPRQ